jgi:MoxR-like ATPase
MSDDLLVYGARLDALRLRRTLDHVFKRNADLEARGQRGTPICLWGLHGLGKTAILQDYAREHGWKLAYCAPAQFEEMGDLHGLPRLVDPDDKIEGDEYTVFAPPEWVPKGDGPGLLLIDDLNRADDRILRGLMQLFQNFEMFSWALPKGWQIAATANPEGGDYSVTPLDDAMLTRMLHLTLEFDANAWATWASSAGIDERGISFVLTHPEAVTGKRTTARSLTQFFEQIASIPDLRADLELVTILAQSALDEVTVATFLAFVNDNLAKLVDPADILDAPKFVAVEKRIEELAIDGDARRVDRLATMCTRLYLALTHRSYAPGDKHAKNLVAFLMLDALPNDLRVSLHRDLLRDGSDAVKVMLRDPKLAKLMLAGM